MSSTELESPSQLEDFVSWLAKDPRVRINPNVRIADLRSQDARRGIGMFYISFLFLFSCWRSLEFFVFFSLTPSRPGP